MIMFTFMLLLQSKREEARFFNCDPIVCFNVIALRKTFSKSALMEKAPFF